MTNNRAMKLLRLLKEPGTMETNEALDMAIEALKAQEVTEKVTQELADKINEAYAKGYKDAKREIAIQDRK